MDALILWVTPQCNFGSSRTVQWHVPIPFSPDVRLAHDAAFSMQFYNCQNIFSVYNKSSLHFHFHYVWVAGVVVVVERWMLLLRDSLRHSRWCCCSWCVRAYGLAVRRLLEGTLDYTTSSGRSSERCSELRFHYYYGLSTPDFDYDRKVGKCFF